MRPALRPLLTELGGQTAPEPNLHVERPGSLALAQVVPQEAAGEIGAGSRIRGVGQVEEGRDVC